MPEENGIIATPTNGAASPRRQTIIDVLLSEHALTPQQYEDLKLKSVGQNIPIESVLESQNIVSEAQIAEARAKLFGIPFVTLSSATFSPSALGLIPKTVAQRFSLIPFLFDDKTKILSIAMSNPVDLDAIEFVQKKTGLTIRVFAASKSDVLLAIETQYRQELVGDVKEALKETEDLSKTQPVDTKQILEIIKEAPVTKIVSTILEYAVISRASDIHIEPQEDRVRVRYRIDGILYDKLTLPKVVQEAVISRIKILSQMKIDEHRIPQDGRFEFTVKKQSVDLRVSVIPTVNGETVALRLLRKSGGIPTLTELGLTGLSLKNLETSILRPHGIIIVCGPTGSGKTSTLYSILSRLNTARVHILSLEDPVEYQIPGISQVQISPQVGLTFATGLRAFLRQDPNIILVGEIRDKDTTDLALQAALTGHLVFSTLHTSDASGVLPRLLDLGAENFLLASTMNAVVGQRIVRRICQDCIESYNAPSQLTQEIKKVLGNLFPPNSSSTIVLYRGKGCSECGHTGYKGRLGIFEVIPISEKIAQLILEHSDSSAFEKQAIQEGMITMKQDGYLKALKGNTSLEEVIRVAQE